jgi:hypothetical protein
MLIDDVKGIPAVVIVCVDHSKRSVDDLFGAEDRMAGAPWLDSSFGDGKS